MATMKCPGCGQGNTTGQVGNRQYYCWNCMIEFQVDGNSGFKLFSVEEDGSLVELHNIEASVTSGSE